MNWMASGGGVRRFSVNNAARFHCFCTLHHSLRLTLLPLSVSFIERARLGMTCWRWCQRWTVFRRRERLSEKELGNSHLSLSANSDNRLVCVAPDVLRQYYRRAYRINASSLRGGGGAILGDWRSAWRSCGFAITTTFGGAIASCASGASAARHWYAAFKAAVAHRAPRLLPFLRYLRLSLFPQFFSLLLWMERLPLLCRSGILLRGGGRFCLCLLRW